MSPSLPCHASHLCCHLVSPTAPLRAAGQRKYLLQRSSVFYSQASKRRRCTSSSRALPSFVQSMIPSRQGLSPLITHHSPLTTHHSPLTTHHSLLTTHHSPLTTHHSPHHSPLTTHHFETCCRHAKSNHMSYERALPEGCYGVGYQAVSGMWRWRGRS